MINRKYPQWKYKINLSELHDKRHEGELNFKDYMNELFKKIQELKSMIIKEDNDLKEQIEDWEEDIWFDEGNKGISIIKNDNDWEEVDYELNTLYDIGDYKKMIWFNG